MLYVPAVCCNLSRKKWKIFVTAVFNLHSWMTTCWGKSCSFSLPCVFLVNFVNSCLFWRLDMGSDYSHSAYHACFSWIFVISCMFWEQVMRAYWINFWSLPIVLLMFSHLISWYNLSRYKYRTDYHVSVVLLYTIFFKINDQLSVLQKMWDRCLILNIKIVHYKMSGIIDRNLIKSIIL